MGISNSTSSIRGTGVETIDRFARIQGDSLVGSDLTATTANLNNVSVNRIAAVNATMNNASAERLKVRVGIVSSNATLTNASINNALVRNASINNVRIGTPSNSVVVSASGVTKYTGEAGIIFGEIYAYDRSLEATITGTGIGNKIQIKAFDANGLSRGMSPDHTQNHITVNTPGYYMCNAHVHLESGGGTAFEAGMAVYKNNGASLLTNCHGHRNLTGGGGDIGSMSIGGIIKCLKNDTIEVWIWNEDNTSNIVVDDITLSLVQISGIL